MDSRGLYKPSFAPAYEILPAVKQEPKQVPNTEHVTDTGMIHSIGLSTRSPNVCRYK